ncbi:BON domain-containing protein [Chitinophaga sedimenti]|uniref:BON domain-containing protein n=1 Tax=Chitinophaga sedimenti TaxID=2033606 RepID=UPI0020034BF4|nr:BON domain-containing protein [Chitinophaga sedimenti]MCK7557169.1 BON domain-containing protein [Chitinophaga sedimenti]
MIEQLKWNPAVNAAEIGVSVTHGVVTLSGKVQSFNQKIMAEQSVRKVTGVKAIAENLEVGISPNEKRQMRNLRRPL